MPIDMTTGAQIKPAYTHAGNWSFAAPFFCSLLHCMAAMKKKKHTAFPRMTADTIGQSSHMVIGGLYVACGLAATAGAGGAQ